MDKPKLIAKFAIDWNDAQKWIEEQLGYDIRDTLKSAEHYGLWCLRHSLEPDGSSQEQYAAYKAAPDGDGECPEYRDYWRFIIHREDVHNGGMIMVSSDLLEDCEPWQAEITQAFIDEFGETYYWTDW